MVFGANVSWTTCVTSFGSFTSSQARAVHMLDFPLFSKANRKKRNAKYLLEVQNDSSLQISVSLSALSKVPEVF
jgi:hypothetical protein